LDGVARSDLPVSRLAMRLSRGHRGSSSTKTKGFRSSIALECMMIKRLVTID